MDDKNLNDKTSEVPTMESKEQHRKTELLQLTEQLDTFYDINVEEGLKRKATCEDLAYRVTHKVLRKVQTADSRFRASNLVSLGIPYDGLNAEQVICLDMLLQLPIGENDSILLMDDSNAFYKRVRPSNDELWKDCVEKNSLCISSKRILRVLRQYVKRAVSVLRKHIGMERLDKFPDKLKSLELIDGKYNLTLIINEDMRVNILPSFSFPDCRSDSSRKDCPSSSHVIAVYIKPPEILELYDLNNNVMETVNNINVGYDHTTSLKFKWKLSFFVAEKNKIRKFSDGCRIKLLRIVTDIRDKEPMLQALSSDHLKTVFFHENDQLHRGRDWNESKLGKRFLGLLRRLSSYLENGICPSYFIQPPDYPLLNLFENLSKSDLSAMKDVVDNIIECPREFLDALSNK